MKTRLLLVNPAVYDFTAYDYWLKPYGMLSIAGFLREKADFLLFDCMDRLDPFMAEKKQLRCDKWGRGRFYSERLPKPKPIKDIPRYFRRFGLPRTLFQDFLRKNKPCDFVLIQTVMTYWYLGVAEAIEDIRKFWPKAKIILGGNYVTICPRHAKTLAPDLLIHADQLEPLWNYLNIIPDFDQPALWQLYPRLNAAAIKISDGCPFSCTYCSVSKVYGKFKPRPLERAIAEFDLLSKLGVKNIAFYDDALLFDPEKMLTPFLEHIIKRGVKINLHTPNALNARFVTKEIAELMIRAGFKTFYLGFESGSEKWQKLTGSKVYSNQLADAVDFLRSAGADPADITAYQILGHPDSQTQQLEGSMAFVNSLGILGMLADFSPIPGTPDGEKCRKWINLDEPLMHNNTAFTTIRLGFEQSNCLKDLQRKLNRQIKSRD